MPTIWAGLLTGVKKDINLFHLWSVKAVSSLDNFVEYLLQHFSEAPQCSAILVTRWVLKPEDVAFANAKLVARGYGQALSDTFNSLPTLSLSIALTLVTFWLVRLIWQNQHGRRFSCLPSCFTGSGYLRTCSQGATWH